MPTQLEVRPEIADKLAALAKARGVSVDDLLQGVLDGLGLPQEALTEASLEEFERDMDALSEGLEHLPVSYQGTYSREDIYLDHD
jgi:regulator of sirC expression with transglutaminase-like and TPR domain